MYLLRRDKMVNNSTQTNHSMSSSKSKSSNSLLLSKSSISKPKNLPKLAEWSSVTVTSNSDEKEKPAMPDCSVQIINIPANRCSNCNINEISNDLICTRCQSRLNVRKGPDETSLPIPLCSLTQPTILDPISPNTTENTSDVNKNDEFEHKSGQEDMFIQEMDKISH